MLRSFVFLCLFLTCIYAKSPHNPSPKPYDECDEPSDEFFYLVQQWPPGYCRTASCGGKVPPKKFTIHGFWPNYCQDVPGPDWPEYCSGERFNQSVISEFVPIMKQEWPSLSDWTSPQFWQHEWDKHGTCALAYTPFGLDSQHEYFETVLQLHKNNDLFGVLQSHGIKPGNSYSVEEIQAAITDSLGGDAYLHCKGSQNILIEIYVCYNQKLDRVPCSRQGVCKEEELVKFILPKAEALAVE